MSKIKLGLAGKHQYQNANLAVYLAKIFLRVTTGEVQEAALPGAFVEGLERTKWPGRCQTVPAPNDTDLTWFLDGAHTKESLECCVEWFVSPEVTLRPLDNSKTFTRVLVFNCTNGRSGKSLLSVMLEKIALQLQLHGRDDDPHKLFEHVVFCTNVTYSDGGFKGDLTTHAIPTNDLAHLQTQHDLASAWLSLVPNFPSQQVYILPSIEDAIKTVKRLRTSAGSPRVDVLVSGSLHLVGGVIEVAGLSEVAL